MYENTLRWICELNLIKWLIKFNDRPTPRGGLGEYVIAVSENDHAGVHRRE